jgi:hypothetical protein
MVKRRSTGVVTAGIYMLVIPLPYTIRWCDCVSRTRADIKNVK